MACECSTLYGRMVGDELRYIESVIICLQETHFSAQNTRMLKQLGYCLLSHTRYIGPSRKVALFVRNNTWKLVKSKSDPKGQWLICQLIKAGQVMTVCGIYAPNQDDPSTFNYLLLELCNWAPHYFDL